MQNQYIETNFFLSWQKSRYIDIIHDSSQLDNEKEQTLISYMVCPVFFGLSREDPMRFLRRIFLSTKEQTEVTQTYIRFH